MFITYISQWLYQVMQLPVPIVLSPQHIYSITIFNLFTGSLIFGIVLLLFERALNGLRFSDFRIKEKVPETIDINNDSTSMTGYDNMNRNRFPGKSSKSLSSLGQRLVSGKVIKDVEIDLSQKRKKDTRNIGIRLVEPKIKERNKIYTSLDDYKVKKAKERDERK